MTRFTGSVLSRPFNKSWPSRLAASAGPMAAFSLFLSIWSWIGGLDHFYLGSSPQNEPQQILLLASAIAGSVSLALALLDRPRRALYLRHPLFLIPLILAAFTVLTAIFRPYPLLPLFGAINIGDGALFLVCHAITIANLIIWRHNRRFRQYLIAISSLSFATAIALMLLMKEDPIWTPFHFPDVIAQIVLSLVVVILSRVALRRKPVRIFAAIAAILILLVILHLSLNRTAIAAFICILPVVACGHFLVRKRESLRWLAGLSTPSLVLAATFGIISTAYIADRARTEESPFHRLFGEKFTAEMNAIAVSNQDRILMFLTGIETLDDDSLNWLTGLGWGRFPETVQTELRHFGVRTFAGAEDALSGDLGSLETEDLMQRTSWTGANWSGIHSHNIFFEALFAQGIPGLLLMLSWVWFALSRSRDRNPVLVRTCLLTLIVIASTWFLFPFLFFVMVLAFGSAAGGRVRPASFGQSGTNRALPVFFVLLACALAVFLGLATRTAIEADRLFPIAAGDEPFPEEWTMEHCESALDDFGRGDQHLVVPYSLFSTRLAFALNQSEPLGQDSVRIASFLTCAAARWEKGDSLIQLALVDVITRIELLTHPEPGPLAPLRPVMAKDIDRKISLFLQMYPERSDVVAPWLNYLLARGQEAKVRATAEQLLTDHPEDPVALWFSGIVMLGNAQEAADGMQRLRKSLDLHIDHYVPLPPGARENILQATGG